MPSDLTPLAGRARWAVIALVAVIATDVFAIGSDWLEIDLMNRVLDGADVSLDDLDSNDTRQGIAGLLSFGAFIAAVFLFLRWFHAAYRNLKALGQPNLRFTTGWAIGGWFVPFINLWRPKQIRQRHLDRERPGHAGSRRQRVVEGSADPSPARRLVGGVDHL